MADFRSMTDINILPIMIITTNLHIVLLILLIFV